MIDLATFAVIAYGTFLILGSIVYAVFYARRRKPDFEDYP
jgi:hypothetical protein